MVSQQDWSRHFPDKACSCQGSKRRLRSEGAATLDLKLIYLRSLSVRSGTITVEGWDINPGRQTSHTEDFVRDGKGNLAVHATATFSMIGDGAKTK